MFKAFLEVLHDLWNFLLQTIRKGSAGMSAAGPKTNGLFGPTITGLEMALDQGYEAYVRVEQVPCYAVSADGSKKKIALLTYGESVKVLGVKGAVAEIVKGVTHGTVDYAALTTEPDKVFPSFAALSVYGPSEETTVRVRRCLKHHFKNVGSKHLESQEYVLYRLLKDKVAIPWDSINSLPLKSWYQRLLGTRSVKISEEPKTRSVLEYAGKDGVAKQGYVIAVHPDHTILVESVGREKPGEFRLEELSHVEWSEWLPVFISFS